MTDPESDPPERTQPPWPLSPEPFEDFGMDSDKLALYACIKYAGEYGAPMRSPRQFVRDVLTKGYSGVLADESQLCLVEGYLACGLDLLYDIGALRYEGFVARLHPDIDRRVELEVLCRGKFNLHVGSLLDPYHVLDALRRWKNA